MRAENACATPRVYLAVPRQCVLKRLALLAFSMMQRGLYRTSLILPVIGCWAAVQV